MTILLLSDPVLMGEDFFMIFRVRKKYKPNVHFDMCLICVVLSGTLSVQNNSKWTQHGLYYEVHKTYFEGKNKLWKT